MNANRLGVFLTGATGLVGGGLLRRLSQEEPDRLIYVLARHAQTNAHGPNTHSIQGDITLPNLGIPASVSAQICCSVDTIVHCAAATKFTLPLATSREINVSGTANVIQLARRCPNLKTLLHISTTYVAGRRSGPLHEQLLADPDGWFSPYEQSKFEAEQLVAEQANGLPWTIARLSTIAGNSRSGRISQFNYFHQLLRLAPRNPFPFIPGDPEALVDAVADDWVSDALLCLLKSNPAAQEVFHLCAGPSESLRAREVVQMALGRVPQFTSIQNFQAYTAELRRKGEETIARMADVLLLYLPHLEVRQCFLNSKTNALTAQCGVAQPRARDFLPRIIEACFSNERSVPG